MKKSIPIRLTVESALTLLGVVGIVLVRVVFGSHDEGAGAVMHDNFTMIFKFSLILSAVLLFFTVISTLSVSFGMIGIGFSRGLAAAFPVVCSVLMILISLFCDYLTRGSATSITAYIICLGVSEALVFRLPCALSSLIRFLREKK